VTNQFDNYRDPVEPRRRKGQVGPGRKKRRRRGAGAMDGSREERMVPDMQFESYYGKPVVKAPPWEWPIGAYLFLGGVAGGSSLLGLGAQLTDRPILRRNSRLAAITAAGAGSLALIADLGRPERLLNMFRVVKLSSPMNLGSWLLAGFSTMAAVAAAAEVDDLTGRRLPLPEMVRTVTHQAAAPTAGAVAGALGAPLAVYTAVLFGDTSNPAWNAAKYHLPFLFVSSASAASGGLAMITTPVNEAGPARVLAATGAVCDVAVTKAMHSQLDEVSVEPYHHGTAGKLMTWAERLVIAGGVGTLLAGRHRVGAALSGAALLAGSALTRFGVLEAGHHSVTDPKYVVEPQKARLAQRQRAGDTGDNITTGR